jgi:two-component system response regulator BaeR
MNNRVLIVEDEEQTAGILADYLRRELYVPFCISNGAEVVPWVREHMPALILLDLMLPGVGGLEICREIRAFSSVPIIITTARIEEIDRLLGLELGADDYICKPYSPREVVARAKTVLRRSGTTTTIKEKGLLLDETRLIATFNGCDLGLTAVEFRLLQFLVATPGRVHYRQQILDRVYPDQRALNDRAVDNHIKNLRKKISSAGGDGNKLIHSIYGVGYKLE